MHPTKPLNSPRAKLNLKESRKRVESTMTHTKRFRLKLYLRFLSIFSIVMAFMIYGLIQFLLNYVLPKNLGANPSLANLIMHVEWFFFEGVSIVILGCAVLILITHTLPIWLSHLDVSDQGLEYQYWPNYHIRCTWEEVQEISLRKEVLTSEVILLKNATEIGRPITTKLRKKMGMDSHQYFIPLNILPGWPQGELATKLQKHAPLLFERKEQNQR